MSRLMRPSSSSESGSGARRLLARILERSELVAVVDKLSPPVLGQLIEHVGLEDAGELVAVASTPQLERVWDRDLWTRAEPGSAERFDPERFALWLSVMLEAGEAQTVQRLREVPFDLLTLAVHRLVRVLDREIWLHSEQEDDEDASGLHAPWLEFVLVARDSDAWDSVLTALLGLDQDDHTLLRRLLERCRDLDRDEDVWEDDGEEALRDEQALEQDLAAERDQRQATSGYLSESDARTFLRIARMRVTGDAASLLRDPVTHAYFRELGDASLPASVADADADADGDDERVAAEADGASTLAQRADESAAVASLLGLLAESGVLSAPANDAGRALPSHAGGAEPAAREPRDAAPEVNVSLLHGALQALALDAPTLWSERMEELAFLANVFVATGGDGGRPLSPAAALEAASAVCDFGLELQLNLQRRVRTRKRRATSATIAHATDALRRVSADRLFRAGYAALAAETKRRSRRQLQLLVSLRALLGDELP